MKATLNIGPAIKARRYAQGLTLQQLCDATGGAIYTSHLSSIERGKMTPNVAIAAVLANALGVSLDALIEESRSEGMPIATSELARRVPVIAWENAADWAKNPDPARLPKGTQWVLPMDNPPGQQFALVVQDEAMHGPSGPAFPIGATIYVDPSKVALANDFVVGHTGEPSAPTFKKLIRDGSHLYLRALNPQFPMVQVDDTFERIGVVVGMSMRLRNGVVTQ